MNYRMIFQIILRNPILTGILIDQMLYLVVVNLFYCTEFSEYYTLKANNINNNINI